MTTTSYTDNSIFENKQINALCDLLFTTLVQQFPPAVDDPNNYYIYKGVVLSGTAAKILNGDTPEDLKNIVFECDQLDVFEFLQAAIQKNLTGKIIKFKNRIFIYPFDYYFEIWYKSDGNKEIENSGIYIQETAFINPETI
jgi:hypothetical protein